MLEPSHKSGQISIKVYFDNFLMVKNQSFIHINARQQCMKRRYNVILRLSFPNKETGSRLKLIEQLRAVLRDIGKFY